MNCQKVKKILGRYLDKELTDQRIIGLLKEHLDQCASCSRELDSLILIKNLILRKEALPAGEDFWLRLKNRPEINPAPSAVQWVSQAGEMARRVIPAPIAIMVLIIALLFGKANGSDYLNEYIFEDLGYQEIAMLEEDFDFTSWLVNNGS
ncbi:MAG: zf-HC2 domain-containing protein [Candidatus Omnitrophota bacterium]|nr:zf-HC2 domain-containing protein [Candidatus Omnitrophota bacterium]